MTIFEYLEEVKSSLDLTRKFELHDIIDKREVYCKGYDTLIKELSTSGLAHVRNARFISHEVEEDCYTILYIKDIKEYSNFELIQVAEKLYNKRK